MSTAEQFSARAERDFQVMTAIGVALKTMRTLDLAGGEIEGTGQRLDLSREIIGLRQALRLMGYRGDEQRRP